jgi:hypothetical protein
MGTNEGNKVFVRRVKHIECSFRFSNSMGLIRDRCNHPESETPLCPYGRIGPRQVFTDGRPLDPPKGEATKEGRLADKNRGGNTHLCPLNKEGEEDSDDTVLNSDIPSDHRDRPYSTSVHGYTWGAGASGGLAHLTFGSLPSGERYINRDVALNDPGTPPRSVAAIESLQQQRRLNEEVNLAYERILFDNRTINWAVARARGDDVPAMQSRGRYLSRPTLCEARRRGCGDGDFEPEPEPEPARLARLKKFFVDLYHKL